MAAYSLFAPAVAAMRAQSVKFQSIGDNVANSSTPGYKAGQIRFQEMVVGRGSGNIGERLLGTQPQQQVFRDREGVVVGSTRSLDAALSGDGFFVTSTSFNQTDGTLEFTDAGRFSETLVEQGGAEQVYLTDIKGNFLLGWPFDPTAGDFDIDTSSTASLSPIRVDQTGNSFEANPTTLAELSINLPATAATGETTSFDLPFFDGSGDDDGFSDTQQFIATFTKTATTNTWDMTLSGTDGTITAPAAQPISVVFDADGLIESVDGVAGSQIAVTANWNNSGVSNSFTFDLGGSTQYADAATQIDLRTDGNGQGSLSSVALGDKGNVIGTFSNGLQRPIARIAVADFIEPNRLFEAGLTHFKQGFESGDIQLIDLDNTSRVFFTGAALEQSTTDLATEFTDMIVTQRAYSSAATTLKTVDEMVRTATELKN